MPIRTRNGKLEWRFKVDGHEYSHITGLADTSRNRTKALRMEAEARRLVLDGRGSELRLQVEPFTSAAETFIEWAKGEYREHPGSWKRLSVSMTSAKACFGKRPIASITVGDIESYKAMRRAVHQVREVTLRHDLHALSLLFQFSRKHNWCKANPVREVEIPSDADAVRMHVLTRDEETRYFVALDSLLVEKAAKKRTREVRGLRDLRDLAVVMINQGCRPEEVRALAKADVNLETGMFSIARGKSAAAKRTLRMTAATRDVLARRLDSPSVWLFPAGDPRRHIGQHQRLHAAALKKSGLAFVLYDLRHTIATRWSEGGTDIGTIAKWLGHANLRTVQKYIHPSEGHSFAAAERFEALWIAGQPKEGKEAVN